MKLTYIVQGLGELSQAESFALFTKKYNDKNIFITRTDKLAKVIRELGFKVFISKNTDSTLSLVRTIDPDVLFLCNSKTVYMHSNSIIKRPPPNPRPLISCFDSNWLFLTDKRLEFQSPKWLDLIFVVIPKRIFNAGLERNGGHYRISPLYAKKIFAPGFIPSGEKITAIRFR